MTFTNKLLRAISSAGSLLSVGLDPNPERIPLPLRKKYNDPEKLIVEFCRRVVEATKMNACAYKPNTAFFEAFGSAGWRALEQVADLIPSNRILIMDAKRGDIGTTSEKYKEAFFDHLDADAVTLNPLMGIDTLLPYLNDEQKAIFVLAITSNSGSADFLQRRFLGRMSQAEYIADELEKLQQRSSTHIGMVVGATQPQAILHVLKTYREAHLLIPGIGAQGGSLYRMMPLLKEHLGVPIFNSSRGIIYSGGNNENWETAVAEKSMQHKEELKSLTHNVLNRNE